MTLNYLSGRLRRFGLVLALGGALGLASCGGGGGGDPEPAAPGTPPVAGDGSTPAPAPLPAPAPAPTPAPAPAGGPQPAPTAVGVATGAAVSASIGAAGGRVSSGDGRVVLDIPAGALAADTAISMQPITNLAHGGRGAAYRLSPEGQTFLKPVKLSFAYTDLDLQGTAAEVLGAAFQTAGGHWQWAGKPTIDSAARTVSVTTSHFSDWSMVFGLNLLPKSKTIKPKASLGLQVVMCYAPPSAEVTPLGYKCADGADATMQPDARDWAVNGRVGGGSYGTVSGNGTGATYVAPDFEPVPASVAVSVKVRDLNGDTLLLVSNITVLGSDSWTGTASYANKQQQSEVQVTWVLLVRQDNIAQYTPTGVGTIAIDEGQCKFATTSGPLGGSGILIVDYNTSPPTYKGIAATGVWNVARTCTTSHGTETTIVPAGLPFFGGTKDGGEAAAGTVRVPLNPDEPMVIEDHDTDGQGGVFVWRFTRNP